MRTTTPLSHIGQSRNRGLAFRGCIHQMRVPGIAELAKLGIRGGGPLLLALCSSAGALNAQGIIGRVRNEGAGAVVAAEVQLLDAKGNIRARSVTDTAGLFRLVAPIPGRY